MAIPIKFEGSTHHFGPPPGKDEEVGTLDVFSNGQCVVSAWNPTEAERAKIGRGEPIYVSHWTGERPTMTSEGIVMMPVVFPTFVGCESECAAVVVDTGKIWR